MSDYELLDKQTETKVTEKWNTWNYKLIHETLNNKTISTIQYKDTEEPDEPKKPFNVYKYYLGKCSGVLGAAILMKYYTTSTMDFETLNYYNKIAQLSVPMLIGFNFGNYITPITLVYMAISKYM